MPHLLQTRAILLIPAREQQREPPQQTTHPFEILSSESAIRGATEAELLSVALQDAELFERSCQGSKLLRSK